MKDEYLTVGSVLKSIRDAFNYGLRPPIKISMHSDVRKIYDEEIKDFSNEEDVMYCIKQCEIVTDDSLPNDAVFSDVPVH